MSEVSETPNQRLANIGLEAVNQELERRGTNAFVVVIVGSHPDEEGKSRSAIASKIDVPVSIAEDAEEARELANLIGMKLLVGWAADIGLDKTPAKVTFRPEEGNGGRRH